MWCEVELQIYFLPDYANNIYCVYHLSVPWLFLFSIYISQNEYYKWTNHKYVLFGSYLLFSSIIFLSCFLALSFLFVISYFVFLLCFELPKSGIYSPPSPVSLLSIVLQDLSRLSAQSLKAFAFSLLDIDFFILLVDFR